MKKASLAGLVMVLTFTPAGAAIAAEPPLATCSVSSAQVSALDGADAAASALNASVQRRVEEVTGRAKAVKERIADQLRRGVIATTSDGASVTVVTTPEFKRDKELSAPNVYVETGCFTGAELIEADDILFARSWHPDAAKAAFSYSLRANDSRYHISFDARYPEAGKALADLLGKRAVITLADNHRTGRLDDGRLHFGGSGIRDGSQGSNTCTAGFIFYRPTDGLRGGFTAGHCFSNNRPIYSGPKYWGHTFGKNNFPAYDMIAVAGDANAYTNVIHTDSCCPVKRTVVGNDPAWVGQSVCFSGMTTRAICSISVTSTNGTFCDSYGCTPGLIEAIRGGGVLYRTGDSGAPIYTRSGSNNALAVGMLIAAAGNNTIGYGEHLSSITSHLGVSLLTWS